jgi:hypothetical protein
MLKSALLLSLAALSVVACAQTRATVPPTMPAVDVASAATPQPEKPVIAATDFDVPVFYAEDLGLATTTNADGTCSLCHCVRTEAGCRCERGCN